MREFYGGARGVPCARGSARKQGRRRRRRGGRARRRRGRGPRAPRITSRRRAHRRARAGGSCAPRAAPAAASRHSRSLGRRCSIRAPVRASLGRQCTERDPTARLAGDELPPHVQPERARAARRLRTGARAPLRRTPVPRRPTSTRRGRARRGRDCRLPRPGARRRAAVSELRRLRRSGSAAASERAPLPIGAAAPDPRRRRRAFGIRDDSLSRTALTRARRPVTHSSRCCRSAVRWAGVHHHMCLDSERSCGRT